MGLSKTTVNFISNRRFLWNNQTNARVTTFTKLDNFVATFEPLLRKCLCEEYFNVQDKHPDLHLQVKNETFSTTN